MAPSVMSPSLVEEDDLIESVSAGRSQLVFIELPLRGLMTEKEIGRRDRLAGDADAQRRHEEFQLCNAYGYIS